MQTPLELTFRNMAHSDALATHLRQRTERLEHLSDRIVSCHVVVELVGHHQHHGERYRFSIHLGLPEHELLVTRVPSEHRDLENAFVMADRAFDEAERQLEDWAKRQRERRHEVARVDTGRP